jgi:hypothetical protein
MFAAPAYVTESSISSHVTDLVDKGDINILNLFLGTHSCFAYGVSITLLTAAVPASVHKVCR